MNKTSSGFFVSVRMKSFPTIALAFSFVLLSCRQEKEGIVDVSQNPPRLLGASVQPTTVNLDTGTANVVRLSGGNYRITVTTTARAVDADGAANIRSLSINVLSPTATDPMALLTVGPSASSGDTASYLSTFSFVVRRADAGLNTVVFQAKDQSNYASNVFRIPLTVARNNSAPQIFGLSAPDTLQRPTSGFGLFRVTVSASDSDGLADVSEVYFRSINSSNPNQHIQLYDDGGLYSTGDSVAGDGRFSRILSIDPTTSLGSKELRFWARDNAGAMSDSICHFLVVVP